jgi:1,4-dihydroxy-2-naphthoate octaprenyltransferase
MPRTVQAAEGLRRLAAPQLTLASAASIWLGFCAAMAEGPIAWGWLLLTLLGVFLLEVAKNASGEIYDFDSGADPGVPSEDRSPYSGGRRVLVEGLLSRGAVRGVGWIAYLGAAAAGLAIVLMREPRVLWFGLAGVALAYFYHAPPFRLAYRGLGEIAVALVYGPLIACGTYLVQRHSISDGVLFASIPLGVLIAAFLWVNEFPDCRADQAAGKRTWVVRLGRRKAARAFSGLILGAYLLLLLFVGKEVPTLSLLGAAGIPHGAAAVGRLLAEPEDVARVVPAQAWTLLSFLLYAAGAGLGLLFGLP